MISFTLSLLALIVGYLVYGKFVERVFGPMTAPRPLCQKPTASTMWCCQAGKYL